jgi:hypothetical protein
MIKKFLNLEFGLQMIIVALTILLSNQLLSFTTKLMNYPNTLMFNLGLILTFVVFFTQALFIFVGIKSVINYVKQNKIKNNNEQSN